MRADLSPIHPPPSPPPHPTTRDVLHITISIHPTSSFCLWSNTKFQHIPSQVRHEGGCTACPTTSLVKCTQTIHRFTMCGADRSRSAQMFLSCITMVGSTELVYVVVRFSIQAPHISHALNTNIQRHCFYFCPCSIPQTSSAHISRAKREYTTTSLSDTNTDKLRTYFTRETRICDDIVFPFVVFGYHRQVPHLFQASPRGGRHSHARSLVQRRRHEEQVLVSVLEAKVHEH